MLPCPALLAVHIADGVLDPWVTFAGFGPVCGLLALAVWRLREDEVPRVGVLTAAFFVASLVHLPLGVTSAHLLLNGLVAVVLGRRAALAIAVGLFLQAFLFMHGGFTTLGVNICVYALPATVAGVLFRPVRGTKWMSDFALGCVFGGATAAATVGLRFMVLWFGGVVNWRVLPWVVLATDVPVVVVEAVGVGYVVQYLGRVRPEWLTGGVEPGYPSG